MKRIPQLDGMRALAILAVFLHHALKLKMLWMGVDLFFILSGFLITGVLLNAKQYPLGQYFGRFYARRSRRILVPYFVSLLVMSLFFGFAWIAYWYWYLGLTNFLLPLHIPHPEAFDPLWSLAVEEQFYFVWPFAVYFLTERRLGKFALALVLLAPVLRGAFHFPAHWAIYTLTPFRMDLLSVGALLCLAYRHGRERIERWGTPVGLICTATGLIGLLILSRYNVNTYGNTRWGNIAIYECALFTCLGLMLWALSGYKVALLTLRPLTYIGQISYTMYLIHLGVLTLLSAYFSPIPAGAIGLAVTIIYASASWFFLEKPLLGHPKPPKASGAVA